MVAGVSISVLDDGTSRPDLAARCETKYVFTRHDVATLREVLQHSCRRIVHAGPVSTVRSVYFDDPALGACRANIDGVGIRHKTRVRWYDRVQPTERAFFEVKWRRYRTIGKHRLELGLEAAPPDAPYRDFRAAMLRALPDQYGGFLAQETEAVVLVEYQREHFVLRRGRARLTLDYDIRFYPQLGHRRLSLRFAQRLPGIVLIECKARVREGRSLRGALAPLRARPARFSKYVIGCQRLGYVSAR